jgi:hypothetical protein
MGQQIDKDTRTIIVIGLLIVQSVFVLALVWYFRKKENDTLNTLFQMQERIDQIELRLQEKHLDSRKVPDNS